jgi:phosphate uptake regulator
MVVKQILQAYRTYKVIQESEREIRTMIEMARSLFGASALALLRQQEVDFDLYARDREINKLVVDIRKKIVEHLSVTACHNVGGELVFLKVINDIERVGDYSKNLLDLARQLSAPLPESNYHQQLVGMFPTVESFFKKAESALFDGVKEDARAVIKGHLVINQDCEGIVEALLKNKDIPAPEAIALALTARYFKRVSSHLKNVASTAVNPFPHIGYMHPEEPVVEEKD